MAFEELTPEQKKIRLYLNQKKLLGDFLARGAITRAQYEKSFGDLTRKMGMERFASADEETDNA